MANLVDTHFHLDMYKNYNELFDYINDNKQYTLCVTNSPGVFYSCINMFTKSKYIKFALGLHPLNTDIKKSDFNNFIRLLPIADYIGEIGLDFSKKKGLCHRNQLEYFEKIVMECSKYNKLMTIHIRYAEKEAYDIIMKYAPKKCIIHWYSGSDEYRKKFEELGCYFSINANMLNNLELLKNISKDRILIESDGPYSKVDNKKFSPQLLEKEYDIISSFLEISNLKETVYENFFNLLTKE